MSFEEQSLINYTTESITQSNRKLKNLQVQMTSSRNLLLMVLLVLTVLGKWPNSAWHCGIFLKITLAARRATLPSNLFSDNTAPSAQKYARLGCLVRGKSKMLCRCRAYVAVLSYPLKLLLVVLCSSNDMWFGGTFGLI